ncbi:hypothetical protein FKM82_005887 [Ascaphus truei]
MLGTDTLKTLMDKVVKIVNYIRSGSSLIHRQFVEALNECDFLVEKRQIETFSDTENPSWQCDLNFLCDIMAHLNELNVKLQGKGKVICELAQHIQEFKSKLNLILVQTQKDDLTHFVNLCRFLEKNEECCLLDMKRQLYINWIKNLSKKFESRFSDFNDFKLAFKFLPQAEDDLLSLHSLEHLTMYLNSSVTDMWKSILTDNDLPHLKRGISKLLSMFESTWVCESTFSTMGFIKSKYRSQIVDVNLETEIRCALSSDIQPMFLQLVRNKDCQMSH